MPLNEIQTWSINNNRRGGKDCCIMHFKIWLDESKLSVDVISVNWGSSHSGWASDFFNVINNPPWHFQRNSANRMHFLIRQITCPPQTQYDVHFILLLSKTAHVFCFLLVNVLPYWSIYLAMRLNKFSIEWFNATDNVVRWGGTKKKKKKKG